MHQPSSAATTRAYDAVGSFLSDVKTNDISGERVASAFAEKLSGISADRLPPAAQDPWRKIARLLRAPADRAVPDRSTHAMRSWPHARVTELIDLVRELHAVLEKIENDRLEDEIRDKIRHHYL